MNIWPWSKFRKLEKALQKEKEFSNMVIGYLNELDPGRCTRFGDELLFWCPDHVYLLSKDTSGWVI
jgi:hypothetical protein